jgi:hypothetical protein
MLPAGWTHGTWDGEHLIGPTWSNLHHPCAVHNATGNCRKFEPWEVLRALSQVGWRLM